MIEEEFGVKIVERTSKGVLFTEQGKYLVRCAEKMIENLNSIKRELRSMEEKLEGTIRIGSADKFSQKTLPAILSEYRKLYPEVDFDIVTGWSEDICKLLWDKKIDIAFVRGEYNWSQGEKVLFTASISVISLKKLELDKLPTLNRIEYSSDNKLKSVIDGWWNGNFSTPSMKGVRINSIDSCIEMVKKGLGYAIVPSTVIKGMDELYRTDLRDKDGNKLVRKTRAFYTDQWSNTKFGKSFLKFLDDFEFEDK